MSNEKEDNGFKDKLKKKWQRFQAFLSFIGAVFFVVTTLLFFNTNFKDSPYFKYIAISVLLYLVIYVAFLIFHRNNVKKRNQDTAKFKSFITLFKILYNLFFISSSILILLESSKALESGSITAIVELVLSSSLLFIKLAFFIVWLLWWAIQRSIRRRKEMKKITD